MLHQSRLSTGCTVVEEEALLEWLCERRVAVRLPGTTTSNFFWASLTASESVRARSSSGEFNSRHQVVKITHMPHRKGTVRIKKYICIFYFYFNFRCHHYICSTITFILTFVSHAVTTNKTLRRAEQQMTLIFVHSSKTTPQIRLGFNLALLGQAAEPRSSCI